MEPRKYGQADNLPELPQPGVCWHQGNRGTIYKTGGMSASSSTIFGPQLTGDVKAAGYSYIVASQVLDLTRTYGSGEHLVTPE